MKSKSTTTSKNQKQDSPDTQDTKDLITINSIYKTFQVPVKGQKGLKSIFVRKNKNIDVLKNLSFTIKKGEFVGYLGPNGAGKSTTIKLMTGILFPTKGDISIMGYDPYHQRYAYTKNIGVVFGQRSLLEYDIPVIDSFSLYKAVYEIDNATYKKRLAEFTKLLDLKELLHIPVRKLSLGQRMRCEIAASLLHKPSIIFLDEPTIGLDALAKKQIRSFLRYINKTEKTTIILTTHDMDDIEQLAQRVIFINKGEIIYDGGITALKEKYITTYDIHVVYAHKVKIPTKIAHHIIKQQDTTLTLRIEKKQISHVTKDLLALGEVKDITIHGPKLEDVVEQIYTDHKND